MYCCNAREFIVTKGHRRTLSIAECFYMATLKGAKVCGLENKDGSYEIGKEFYAYLVRTMNEGYDLMGVMKTLEEEDTTRTILEKFLMNGDDRNIVSV